MYIYIYTYVYIYVNYMIVVPQNIHRAEYFPQSPSVNFTSFITFKVKTNVSLTRQLRVKPEATKAIATEFVYDVHVYQHWVLLLSGKQPI